MKLGWQGREQEVLRLEGGVTLAKEGPRHPSETGWLLLFGCPLYSFQEAHQPLFGQDKVTWDIMSSPDGFMIGDIRASSKDKSSHLM